MLFNIFVSLPKYQLYYVHDHNDCCQVGRCQGFPPLLATQAFAYMFSTLMLLVQESEAIFALMHLYCQKLNRKICLFKAMSHHTGDQPHILDQGSPSGDSKTKQVETKLKLTLKKLNFLKGKNQDIEYKINEHQDSIISTSRLSPSSMKQTHNIIRSAGCS